MSEERFSPRRSRSRSRDRYLSSPRRSRSRSRGRNREEVIEIENHRDIWRAIDEIYSVRENRRERGEKGMNRFLETREGEEKMKQFLSIQLKEKEEEGEGEGEGEGEEVEEKSSLST